MTKYRLYIDEVGNPDLKSSHNLEHRFLGLTGVIFDLAFVNSVLNQDLQQIKTDFFSSDPDEPITLHRKEILNAKPPFRNLANEKMRGEFNDRILRKLEKWDYQVVTVLIDKLEHKKLFQHWKHDPYHYCQEILMERYKLFLELNNAIGDVMVESRGKKEDRRLKQSFKELMTHGTRYIKASNLSNTISSHELKVKNKEHNIAGLQVADLIAHPCRRMILNEYCEIKDGKRTFGDEVVEILKSGKLFSYKNRIEGFGVKKLP